METADVGPILQNEGTKVHRTPMPRLVIVPVTELLLKRERVCFAHSHSLLSVAVIEHKGLFGLHTGSQSILEGSQGWNASRNQGRNH